MRAGQRIFMLDGTNMSSVLPLLQLAPDVLSDISNAINNGLSVITHERNITIDGWTGAGYVIADPKTGGGAYRISGGANGGNIQSPQGSALELSGLTDTQINEHLDIYIAGIVPAAKAYDFKLLTDKAQSIMVKVIRKIATAEVMEDLRVKLPDAANDPIWDPVKDPFNPKNLGKIGLWEIALQILFIETIVDKIERASRMDVPLYVQGTGRPGGKSQLEVAEHWRDAQQGWYDENSGTFIPGLPQWLHYAGLGFERDNHWYNYTSACNEKARILYASGHGGNRGQCDEYPPQAATEGGVTGDAFLKLIRRGSGVSLKLMNGSPNMSSGRTMGWFLRFCGISEMFDPFIVKPSTSEQTGGYRHDGTKCY